MSTSSFLTTVVAVLSDQQQIPELPYDDLLAFRCAGPAIEEEIPLCLLLKVSRLQTLAARVHDNAEMPNLEGLEQIAEETESDLVTTVSNLGNIQEDSIHRVRWLERLIVEVVREAFPQERERFDVRYIAHIDKKIVRLPAPSDSLIFD
jgi:hypothetical protein